MKSTTQRNFPPHICFTVSGCLVVDHKILLVKHRKAGFWLKPGGHLEPNELPHQAAVREFEEETGVSVKAKRYGFLPKLSTPDSEFLPLPFAMNVHWVSRENYQQRMDSTHLEQLTKNGIWQRGCEQHCHMDFLLEPASNSLVHKLDSEESLDIGWFSLEEVLCLDTTEDIKSEIQYAFQILTQ